MKAIIIVCLIALAFAATAAPADTKKAAEAKLSPTAVVQIKIDQSKKREQELTKEIANDLVTLKKAQAKLQQAQEAVKKLKAPATPVQANATATAVKTVAVVAKAQQAVANVTNNTKPAAPAVPVTEAEKKVIAELNALEQDEAKIRREMRELRHKKEELRRKKEREAELAKQTSAIAKAELEVKHATEEVKAAQTELDKDLKELATVQATTKNLEKELKKLNLQIKLQAANTRKGQLVQEIVDDVSRIGRESAKLKKAEETFKKVNATKAEHKKPEHKKPVEIKTVAPVEKITIPNVFESEAEKKLNEQLLALELTELNLRKKMREAKRKEWKLKVQKEREAELAKHKSEVEKAALAIKHAKEDVEAAQKELDKDIEELTEVNNRVHATEAELKKLK